MAINDINLFGKDIIIGDFKLSNYKLILVSFDDKLEVEDKLGMNYKTVALTNKNQITVIVLYL